MPIRRGIPYTFRPHGLSDAIDGSNAFPGALQMCANLIPAVSTKGVFVPRPAAAQLAAFAGFTTPAGVTALLAVGTKVWGMVASADFAGKDVPFCYDLSAAAYIAISGELAGNLPTTQSTSGDWTPPTLDVVGGRIVVTHPGFPGGATKFGWIDISSFSSSTITGSTHTSTLIDTLSANPILAGWAPGMKIAGAGITAGTTIVSLTAASVTLSAATSASAAGVALTVTGGTAAVPLWGAGDTNTNNLAATPVAVKQFNGRAYFAVPGGGVVFSDSGAPCQVTNASQALTFRNGLDVTAFGGLGLASPISGGIVQSLICFQGAANLQQITGDTATSNLSTNDMKVPTGTLAPNTIAPIPQGLGFISPEGLRVIDLSGRVSEPIGDNGDGVAVPFQNAINPSRMCAAYNRDIYRVSVKNGAATNQPTQEYWFDFARKVWTGPHSFPAAVISPIETVSISSFVMAASGIDAKLWQSDVLPTTSSSYTENGSVLSWTFQTTLLPDNEQMAENAVQETTWALDLPPLQAVTIQALDETAAVLDTVFLNGTTTGPTVWGSFTWGGALWLGGQGVFQQRRISWHNPLVFKQMSIRATGNSLLGLAIGNIYAKYQPLGYLIEAVA